MAKKLRKIETPDIPALIMPLLLPEERVQSCDYPRADYLSVALLMFDSETQEIIDTVGRGLSGRTLNFKIKSGRWTFVGEGFWRE